jgi:hypothetical protein
MIAVITKKRLLYALVIVLVVLAVLSFVLPFVGESHGGPTPLP